MKVLMIGAAGNYAGLVVPELTKRGVQVRALVRDEQQVQTARERGAAETVMGDLHNPDSLQKAAEGMDGVFHINPAFAPDEDEMGVAMVEAAKATGVRKFVFSSVYHPSIAKMRNHAAKQPVEEALYESGMVFTVLQPAMFMQNLESGWPAVARSGRIAMPYSTRARVCYVDYRDVAETAALALTGDMLDYGTFELCAPGMINRLDMAALMSDALGRPVEAGETPFAEWADRAKMPEGPLREGLQVMNAHYDQYGFPGGNAVVLRTILGREPRTLRQYIQELASQPTGETMH
ncbi:SDR family oxidoreductase [Spirosoma arcticum]